MNVGASGAGRLPQAPPAVRTDSTPPSTTAPPTTAPTAPVKAPPPAAPPTPDSVKTKAPEHRAFSSDATSAPELSSSAKTEKAPRKSGAYGVGSTTRPTGTGRFQGSIDSEGFAPRAFLGNLKHVGATQAETRKALSFFEGNRLFETPNAKSAGKTYAGLLKQQKAHPGRLTDSHLQILTKGVAEGRTDTDIGLKGVLGRSQAKRAGEVLTGLPQTQFDALQGKLDSAGSDTERQLILKAAAARKEVLCNPAHPKFQATLDKVLAYGDSIRGKPRDELVRQSTVVDLGGQRGLQQRFLDSCAPTTAQMTKAEADPIYAAKLNREGINSLDTTGRIGQKQDTWLRTGFGIPVPRTAPPWHSMYSRPMDGPIVAGMLNTEVAKRTNRQYQFDVIPDTNNARSQLLDKVDKLLDKGLDVPIGVRWPNGGGHVMFMSDVRGSGDKKQYLVTDPWHGTSEWIKGRDIVQNTATFGGGNGRIDAAFTTP